MGQMLREWRHRRHRSQMDLSLEVGVSTRHLSFVETGRSRPSPELVVTVADHLQVPLRERNRMLLAAGYAPRYGGGRSMIRGCGGSSVLSSGCSTPTTRIPVW